MKTNQINLIKSLPIIRSIKDVTYEPGFYFQYSQNEESKSLPFVFQTNISKEEKGAVIKARNKSMFAKSAVFGFSAFISIGIMSVIRGNAFTMEHFLAFLIQAVLMVAVVSLVLIIASIIIPKAYPDKILFLENRLKVVNSKGKADIDIPYSDIAYTNIVTKNKQKFLCFSAQAGGEGSVLKKSPIFDITKKADEVYLTKFLNSLSKKTGSNFVERRIKA